MIRPFLILCVFLFLGNALTAQIAADCTNAVPICNNTPVNGGTQGYANDDFNGASSTGCLETSTSGFIESNSAWYRFRTAAAGQLGFSIGHDSSEDWDFALYLASDCNNLGDPIRCNFFDNRDGNSFTGVGEDPSGDMENVQFEDWLQVEPGQDYYLLINNFSSNNSGFSIQFNGNIFVTNPYDALDCSIVSNLLGPPIAACENENVVLNATTNNAVDYTWFEDTGSGFNEILGEKSETLQVVHDAIYRVRVVTPTETLISDVQVAFNPIPVTEPVQNITYCFDQSNPTFDLSSIDAMAKGAQSAQEFVVSYHNSQQDAELGQNPLPKEYVKAPGNETIYIRTTSIANSDCYDANVSFQLNALERPNLQFEQEVAICENNPSVTIGEPILNPNFTYEWDTGETSPNITVNESGSYTLTVYNIQGGSNCGESRTVTVNNSMSPAIEKIEISDLSSNNTVEVITAVEGNYEFQLNDNPFQKDNTFTGVLPGTNTITIRDLDGCGSFTDEFVVVGFPNHFSPNGDVANETWRIEGLQTLQEPVVSIYDRYGKLLQQITSSGESWDGFFNGQALPATDYWFRLTYINSTGNRVEAKYVQNHFSLRR